MNVVRLARTSFSPAPHRELRQKSVFASRGRNMGTVENLYVEEDSRDMRFVDVVTNGFLGLGR
jgi:sporulation protein YlmC with PRC-barrel domain